MTFPPAPPSRWKSFASRFVLFVLIGLALAALSDRMPHSEAAKRGLTRLWGPALTVSYPVTGRDQVTVMLLDDEDLEQYAEVWPAPLAFHKRRLIDLLKYGPKAVFFDFIFLDDRDDPDLDGFIAAACRARAAGVRIFIGSFGNAGIGPTRTEAAMLARRVAAGGASLPCIEPAYMNLTIDGYDQSVWEYDLELPAADGAAHSLRYPSPAARLYAAGRPAQGGDAPEAPMAIVWGTEPHPVNLAWMNNDGNPGGPGAPCASTWHITRVLPLSRVGSPICPYSRTLPVRALKAGSGVDPEDMREAVAGKYIIYGASLQSNGDTVVSPYHGRIPGAYVHAMALDNLLSFQGMPKTGGDFLQPPAGRATWFTILAVLAISAFIAAKSVFAPAWLYRRRPPAWLLRYGAPGNPFPRYPWASAFAGTAHAAALRALVWTALRLPVMLATVLLIAVLVAISYFGMDLGPLVWIEYVLFPLAADFIGMGERTEEMLREAHAHVRKRRDELVLAAVPAEPQQPAQ